MDSRKTWCLILAGVLVVLGAVWFFLGPSGQATVEAIDQTASQATGHNAVNQGQALRQEVQAISTEQKDRLRGIGLDRGGESR
jgi:hypothetical protein